MDVVGEAAKRVVTWGSEILGAGEVAGGITIGVLSILTVRYDDTISLWLMKENWLWEAVKVKA